MSTSDLFEGTKPRRPRRVMMHVTDAGDSGCGGDDGGSGIAQFTCAACGHETDWLPVRTISEAKRGLPCPNCNPKDTFDGGAV